MNLYIMRHGRTNYNELELCNDDPIRDVHLTAIGKLQAQRAAEQLRQVAFDRIIVSPLPRTRQTADIINQYHNISIETHPLIADIRTGFDNKPVDQYFAAIAHDPINARVNNGESLLDHKQRIESFIKWLRQQPAGNILVIAHEETVRVFIAHFEGGIADHHLRDLRIENCEYRNYQF